jgi:HK97 family phage portal protein
MGLLERVAQTRSGELARSRTERRAVEVPWRPWDSRYVPFSAGGPSHPSYTQIGMEGALRLGPLFAGARLLADKVASLPLQTYRKLPAGNPTPIATTGLLASPAAYGTIYDWVHMCMVSLVLTGNAWGLITGRDGYGYPTGIEWLPPERVEVVEDYDQPWNPTRSRIYFYGRQMAREEIFHIRAFSVPGKVAGLSPLRLFMDLIQAGQDALGYGASWYKSGGFPPGTFQNQEVEVDAEQADEIRRRLTKSIQRREPLVYGRDWDYKPVSVPPSEAQFIEAMQLNATQIAAILGIPPERIGGSRGDSLTYSTQEQESIALLTDTLSPWLVRIETALFEVLPAAQYVRFNTKAMLKTTVEQRFNIYRQAREIGVQTANEIRALEEWDPLPGAIGDDPLPLEVLVAMARGIKEIPRSMESLVEMAPTAISEQQTAKTVAAASRPANGPTVVVGGQHQPGQPGSANGSAAPVGDVKAAARAARERWAGDYDWHPDRIRALMNGARH